MNASLGTERHGGTVGDAVGQTAATLIGAGIPDALAEARDLVAAVLQQPRFWPGLHPEMRLEPALAGQVRVAAARRAGGAPFAYAVGRAAFRHLTLDVDDRVLIPRQETEVLVDLILEDRSDRPPEVAADVGTGSGAIALALASEAAFTRIIATDVSPDALAVAEANAARIRSRLRSPVEFRQGAGLSPLANERVDVLACNPPYVAFDEAGELPASVRDWEPVTALFSAHQGLAMTREVIRGSAALLKPDGLLALEVDVRRASIVAELLASTEHYRRVRVHLDLTGRERFVLATRA